MKRHILVISNENRIGQVMEADLGNEFTTVSRAGTSIQALEMIMQDTYNLIIFDISIRDMNGEILLQIIRKVSDNPILVLTQQKKIEDRMKILDLGADICLVWPVDINELIVQAETCMKRKRCKGNLRSVIIHNIGLVISPGSRSVEIRGREVPLTKREFDVLYLLTSNPGVVFSKEQIYALIWEGRYIKDDSNIMSHIGRLRKKLGPEAGGHIQNVWGIGYRFTDEKKMDK